MARSVSRTPPPCLPLALLFPLFLSFTLLCSAKAISLNTEPRTSSLIPTGVVTRNATETDGRTPSQRDLDRFISGPTLTLTLDDGRPVPDTRLASLVLAHLLTNEASGVRDGIRQIEARGWDWDRGTAAPWDLLAQRLAPQLARLVEMVPEVTDLRWDTGGGVSTEVLSALEAYHPAARLHVCSSGGHVPRCSRNLHSVAVRAGYGCTPARRAQAVLPATLALLQTCPSIKALNLTIESCGCVHTMADHCAFDLRDRRKWKAGLERLALRGYCFDAEPRPETYAYAEPWTWRGLKVLLVNGAEGVKSGAEWVGRVARGRNAPGIEGHGATNLDAWMEAMDWRSLQELRIADSPVSQLPKLASQLNGLEVFELGRSLYGMYYATHVAERAAVLDFLGVARPLRELGLSGMGGGIPLGEVLERHGPGLESLELHEKEVHYDPTVCATRERDTLSVGKLEGMREMCPRLKRLEVDVDRNGSWPDDILRTLATFPTVSHLTLKLQLGILNETYTLPRLDNSTALSIFQSLRSQKRGIPLQSLELVLGEWGEHMGGGFRYIGWDEDRRGFYVCEVQEGEESCWVGGGDLCFGGQNASMWPCDEGGKYKGRGGGVKDEL